jgi:hypothetical protein
VGLGLIVALGLLVLVPLFSSVWFNSHESLGQVPTNRYWVRLFEFIRAWRDWQIYPRWVPDTNGGFGSPIFVFRSPGLFVLASPFVFFGATYAMALKLATALLSAAGAAGAYLLVFGETRRVDASLVGAAAWIYAPYRFVDLYVRGDLTEYAAVCLFPLVLWLYRELGRVPREKIARTAALAALAHAALIYSHTVEAQWGTEVLFLMVLPSVVAGFLKGDTRRVLALGFAFAFALGLAAAYLLPALHYKDVYGPADTTGYYASIAHLVPVELFFRFDFFEFVSDGMLGSPYRMPFSIGYPAAAALALGLGAVAWRARVARQLVLWLCVVLGLLFIMTPASIPLWQQLPFGKFTQFPWRLLGLVAGLSAGLIGICWAGLVPWPRLRWVLCVAALAWIARDGRRFVRVRGMNLDPTMTAESVQRVPDLGLDGPCPSAPPTLPRPPSLVVVSGPIQAAATEPRATEYDVTIQAQGPGTVDVQSYWFPCWQIIEQEGPAAVTLESSADTRLRLSVPAAGSYKLRVAFRPTPIFWFAEFLSLLCLVLLWPVMRRVTSERSPSPLPPVAIADAALAPRALVP